MGENLLEVIIKVLERNDTMCLDNEEERQDIAGQLENEISEYIEENHSDQSMDY